LVIIGVALLSLAILIGVTGVAKEQRIIEDRCEPKWAICMIECANYSVLMNELDVCVEKCDIGREACSVLEK